MTVPSNPNVGVSVTPILGVNFNRRTNILTETNPAEFALGTTVMDAESKVWVYVHAPLAIGSNNFCTVSWQSRSTIDVSSVITKTTNAYVNSTAAFAADDYGWVQSVRRLGETNYKP